MAIRIMVRMSIKANQHFVCLYVKRNDPNSSIFREDLISWGSGARHDDALLSFDGSASISVVAEHLLYMTQPEYDALRAQMQHMNPSNYPQCEYVLTAHWDSGNFVIDCYSKSNTYTLLGTAKNVSSQSPVAIPVPSPTIPGPVEDGRDPDKANVDEKEVDLLDLIPGG